MRLAVLLMRFSLTVIHTLLGSFLRHEIDYNTGICDHSIYGDHLDLVQGEDKNRSWTCCVPQVFALCQVAELIAKGPRPCCSCDRVFGKLLVLCNCLTSDRVYDRSTEICNVCILVVLGRGSGTGCHEFIWYPVDLIFLPYFLAQTVDCFLGMMLGL